MRIASRSGGEGPAVCALVAAVPARTDVGVATLVAGVLLASDRLLGRVGSLPSSVESPQAATLARSPGTDVHCHARRFVIARIMPPEPHAGS